VFVIFIALVDMQYRPARPASFGYSQDNAN